MDVTLLGHSFIRRLRDALLSEPQDTPRGRPRRHGDVLPDHRQRAEHLVQQMRLSNHFSAAYTVSEGIIFIRDVVAAAEVVLSTNPAVLIIDIGSNDIARLHSVQPRKMLKLAHQLHDHLSSWQIPLIVVNAVLPRTHRINGPPEIFRDNSLQFNTTGLNYDRHFRLDREASPFDFATTRQDLLLHYQNTPQPNNKPTDNFRPQSQIKRSARQIQTKDGIQIPMGYCMAFHSRNEHCRMGTSCPYNHRCHRCNKGHPVYWPCNSVPNGSNTNKTAPTQHRSAPTQSSKPKSPHSN
jgi:lysophospholipase L1-like esterase